LCLPGGCQTCFLVPPSLIHEFLTAIADFRYAPIKIEYGMNRYINETKRLYGVIEKHLEGGREWLAADQYTLADIANFTWIFCAAYAGLNLDEFPNVKAWVDRIFARPAVQRGLNIPDENRIAKAMQDPTGKVMEEMIKEAQGMMVSTEKK
jgi:glutathione S-transferase